jgi:hypothetical protein
MKQKIIGTILILIAYSIFITHLKTSKFDIAQIIGTTIGLIILPVVIALIISFIHRKIYKTEKIKWAHYFIILTVIFVISNLVSTINKINQSDTLIESSNKTKNENKFIYSPKLSSFVINFPKSPTELKTYFIIDSETIEGEMMELTTQNPEILLRVEYLKNQSISQITTEQIIEKLNQKAYSEGMSNPIFDSKKHTYGEEYNLRMFKNLESEKKTKTPITYDVKLIKIGYEIISITTACESQHYPTSSIMEFLNSLQIKYKKSP